MMPPHRYDSHRDAILKQGGRHQAGAQGDADLTPERPADEPDLFAYFSSSCYSGYSDSMRVGGCPLGVCLQTLR